MTTLDLLDAALAALDDIRRRVRDAQAEIRAIVADTRWQAAAVAAYRHKAAAIEQRLGLVESEVADAWDRVSAMRVHAAAIGAG
jgi:hypothetical protein